MRGASSDRTTASRSLGNETDSFVGSRVRLTRENRCFSSVYLARLAGMEERRLDDCEQGRIRFRAAELHAISVALGVRAMSFFPGRSSGDVYPHLGVSESVDPNRRAEVEKQTALRLVVSNDRQGH